MKYGDVVLKLQSADGKVTMVPAIVLGSTTHVPVGGDRKPIAGAEAEVHVDIAYPDLNLVREGETLKTRDVASIFKLAYDVAPWRRGAAIGYVGEGQNFEAIMAADSGDLKEKYEILESEHTSALLTIENLRAKLSEAGIPFEDNPDEQGNQTNASGAPSAEDLDKVAAEQAVAEATQGQPAAEAAAETEQS